ncbi:MAG: hypothetical protein PHH54_06205 [Candidatus Nanoarchaeia archaeon]|nr:hypothetical protein [Candidatus Nanoarchaeia archaeon]MDD5741547.1 hypothetical protein [Candidatus Nanoarchaeia archaeon]
MKNTKYDFLDKMISRAKQCDSYDFFKSFVDDLTEVGFPNADYIEQNKLYAERQCLINLAKRTVLVSVKNKLKFLRAINQSEAPKDSDLLIRLRPEELSFHIKELDADGRKLILSH